MKEVRSKQVEAIATRRMSGIDYRMQREDTFIPGARWSFRVKADPATYILFLIFCRERQDFFLNVLAIIRALYASARESIILISTSHSHTATETHNTADVSTPKMLFCPSHPGQPQQFVDWFAYRFLAINTGIWTSGVIKEKNWYSHRLEGSNRKEV